MKIKEVNVRIEKERDFDKRIIDKLKEIDKRKYNEKLKTNVSFESIDDLRKILTKRRLQLLRFIKHKKPASIYQLAIDIGRDRKSVTTDINILHNLGFLELKEKKNLREVVMPSVNFDKVEIKIPI